MLSYRSAIRDAFIDPRRGFGFFTFVAGTKVLGVRLAMDGRFTATALLLAVAERRGWSSDTSCPGPRFSAARPVVATTPRYWVAMGACAITVLAGARIVAMEDAPMVDVTRGLVAGVSVVFWAFATWLIPVLSAAGWWRHRTHRVPLAYDATLWSIVFPLGMYAVAGIYFAQADRLPLVRLIGGAELWFAFAAWLLTFVAMVVHVTRTVALAPRPR